MNNYLQYHNPVECQKLGIRNRKFHTSLENNWNILLLDIVSRVKTVSDELKKKNTKSKLQHTTLECCDDNKKEWTYMRKKENLQLLPARMPQT